MRNKWRSIVVNQQAYKWRVENVTIFGNPSINKRELILFLSFESKRTSQYTITFVQIHDNFERKTENDIVITPGLVAKCIGYALDNGWKPEISNEPTHFDNGYVIWREFRGTISTEK